MKKETSIRNKYLIFIIFSGFVDSDKVVDYNDNRSKYVSKGKGFDFTEAVKKIEEYISDPVVCYTSICYDAFFII